MGQYDKVGWRGEPISRGQRQALIATENEIQKKYRGFQFQVPQGSWQDQTSYSGTSHTRANVVDLQYAGLYGDVGYTTRAEKEKYRFVLRALKGFGCQAAFGRGPWDKDASGNPQILHFHTCDLNCLRSADTVRYFQIPQYKLGYNGLNAGVRDKFAWRPDKIRAWRYKG
jgi:hypothetical protein